MKNEVNKVAENKNEFINTKEFIKRNQWYQLKKMTEQGLVTKVKRGVYYAGSNTMLDQQVEVSKIIPDGVLCMFSAWFYYNLTTTIPHKINIAITQNKKLRLPSYPPIKLYYLSENYYELGITEIHIENQPVKIYDLEKSVCDAVRFRNKIGMDIAIEVVRNYVKRRKERDFDKLTKYARQLRIESIMQSIIMPML